LVEYTVAERPARARSPDPVDYKEEDSADGRKGDQYVRDQDEPATKWGWAGKTFRENTHGALAAIDVPADANELAAEAPSSAKNAQGCDAKPSREELAC
jgi:hypothetical protein